MGGRARLALTGFRFFTLACLGSFLGGLTPVQAATENYYIGPSGSSGGGSAYNDPAPFNIATLNGKLGGANDLTVWFLPGEYIISQTLGIAGTVQGSSPTPPATRQVRLKGYVGAGTPAPYATSPRPVLKLAPIQGSTYWGIQPAQHWLIKTVDQQNTAPYAHEILKHYLGYFELKDLILDGDFDAQGAYTGPGSVGGYKSFAVDVFARTGLISDVLVRRFGSSGGLPWTYYSAAGTEAFPIRVGTGGEDKVAGDWNLAAGVYPWVINKVEVTDMRFQRGGYGSLILPWVINTVAPPLDAEPIIVVRRCQVRSHPHAIAFGIAASSTTYNGVKTPFASRRIRFEDNVVLNSGLVLNTDTGTIGWVTFRRNAFLDILSGAQLGLVGGHVGDTQGVANHHHYRFEHNLYRFRGRMNVRDYHDYDEPDAPPTITQPNLALGRLYQTRPAALIFQGRASQIAFDGNWITTWPAGDFFNPSPGAPPTPTDERYRVAWVVQPNLKIDARIGNYNRNTPLAVTFRDSKISTEAFVFLQSSPELPNEVALTGLQRLASTFDYYDSTPNNPPYLSTPPNPTDHLYGMAYSAGYQDEKTPVSTVTFAPKGKIERARPMYDSTTPTAKLSRVREIVLGACTLNGDQVQIQARVLDHYPPGSAFPGTSPAPSSEVSDKVYVRAELYSNGQWVTLNNQTSANPNSSGVLQQTVTMTPISGSLPTHGLVRVRAWVNSNDSADIFSTPVDLNEDADAWASLELPRGTMVTVDALPDVGDDKNITAAKRAKFILKRSTTTGSTSVRMRLRDHKRDDGTDDPRLIKPGVSPAVEFVADYGSTKDYYLSPNWPTGTQTLPYETTVTISSGSEVVFTVNPTADNLTENNVIVLQVLPDPNTTTPAYATGLQNRAEVLLWDGPEYTLVELTAPKDTTVYSAGAVAVNAGMTTSTAWSVLPQAVGTADWVESPGLHGILWTSASIYPAIDFGTGFRPYGISHRASTAAGDRPWVVGAKGTQAWRVLDNNTGGAQLPHFPNLYGQPGSGSGPSLARGISPDGTRSVGYSAYSQLVPLMNKPAWWLNTDTPTSLALNLDLLAEGEALAVNDAGVIVGFCSGFGNTISRPFRSDGSYLDDQDVLPVPTDQGGVPLGNGEGRANAIATSEGNHYAVGSFKDSATGKKRGIYWTGNPLPSAARDLQRLNRNGVPDQEAEALGINSALRIVGWSGPSPTDANRRAVLSVGGATWRDLNDPHFTHGLTDWVLQQANAISGTGVIVGVGFKSGLPTGFMLIPRIPGN